jgi:microcin C transport system permease protein
MLAYFIRRILMMIPTFVGITFLVFTVTRFVPGGPVETAIQQYKHLGGAEASSSSSVAGGARTVSPEMIEKLEKIYGFDKPFYIAYLYWFKNVLVFDLGESSVYSRPVWDVIKDCFPISLRFGLIGFFLSYMVCIPLGIKKALAHGTRFDIGSSALVFLGYSVPGWVVGIVLLVLFGGGSFWNIFPLGGIHSQNYDSLTMIGKLLDNLYHLILPIFCYMLGSFATLTLLMKNSLMENLGADYVRTAYAKGLSAKTVIYKHALRNSIIPIATGFGGIFSVFLAGSFLIERVFNIHGFGMLGYTSIIARDYPVVLGVLVISSIVMLIGNIVSDFLYCIIDPRIRLH